MGHKKNSRKGSHSSSSRESSPEEDSEQKVYGVEAILAVKNLRVRGATTPRYKYLVQWYGYPGEDTWEPYEMLAPDCDRLLQSLWSEIAANRWNSKKKAYFPSREWIESEIEFFRTNCVDHAYGSHSQPAIGYNEDTGQLHVYN